MEDLDPIEELLHQLDISYGPLTQAEIDDGEAWYDQIIQRLFSPTVQRPDGPAQLPA